MTYNMIATGYFTQLIKEYDLKYLCKSKGSLGWEGIYKDKNGQLYAINYSDYMGGTLDILFIIDNMPELES